MAEIPSNIDVDTFATYADALQAAALTTTRLAATSLPADLSFHRSIDPVLSRDVEAFSDRILTLASRLIHIASGKTNRVLDEEDVVDDFVRNFVDPMEGMLESTDSALDVFLGKRKAPAIHVPAVPVDTRQSRSKKQPFRGRLDPALTHASHIAKPQLSFKYTISNTDESPYIPTTLIPHKWCAKVPLGYIFHDERSSQDEEDAREGSNEEERRKRTLHPYYYELTHPSYPDHVFNPPSEPSLPPPLDTPSSGISTTSIPLTFVSTAEAFLSMANAISSATELAVDLEHHAYRSYKGFLALMQISTRQGDFIVDLLVPEIREGLRQGKDKDVRKSEGVRMASAAGQIIARIFADPSVIKVFHGAESDVVWLQQDFNIFVVGLFDTFHASKLLEFPKHSLAYLLETYCDFIPDKRYQLADWRIRPLPSEMSTYARSDTHFLLYVYDMLRLTLIKRTSTTPEMSDENLPSTDVNPTLIHNALTRSSRTALRMYDIEVYDAEEGTGSTGWDTLARKWNKVGLVGSPSLMREVGPQAAVYRAVHRWREDVAREEDESARYVLPTHQLFLLVEHLPTTVPDLLSLFGGSAGVHGSIPLVLKRRAAELVAVIRDTVDATKPTSNPDPRGLAEDGRGSEVVVVSAVVQESEAIILAAPSSSVAKPSNDSRLWTVAPLSVSTATSHSTLFGVSVSKESTQEEWIASPSLTGRGESLSAAHSILFGSALSETVSASSSGTFKSTFTRANVADDSAQRFKELMEKIHKTLVIAPVVSMPSTVRSVKMQVSETSLPGAPMKIETEECASSDPVSPGPMGQIEIPFVPAHKRQTIPDQQDRESKDDTIVIVGASTRQRKRKRDKAKSAAPASQARTGARSDGVGTSTSTGDHDQDVEVFDYSSVPNLLDDEGKHGDARRAHEENEKRKKKQRRGKGSGLLEYGNFRMPPRDQREVRSGNKTQTFR